MEGRKHKCPIAYHIIITNGEKQKLKVLIHWVIQTGRRKSIAFLIQEIHEAENSSLLRENVKVITRKRTIAEGNFSPNCYPHLGITFLSLSLFLKKINEMENIFKSQQFVLWKVFQMVSVCLRVHLSRISSIQLLYRLNLVNLSSKLLFKY